MEITMTIEQQRALLRQLVSTMDTTRIVEARTDLTNMIIQCANRMVAKLMLEMLVAHGFTGMCKHGKQSDNYYIQVVTRDRDGELMAFCSAINAKPISFDATYAALEQRWSDPSYGVTWH
jgi:hypothetical protein